ncbi:Myosin-2 heavy chain, non muscle, putative [Perkinsus marinus ATCC 50983]|uniref:Myosin-2 heavy chain, non muscle, putative n=1 Tax=Perkinsus marinus (strain ATCC 50983 / TXsc) TaxID=423536 RepID=C5KJF1_PERM5|nr:Myosin-2 heavy chain, non muscle, putative [Perkinsus marinus ATCC 50983]EER15453.1 Myosin-2 heavy chain, non muscle, putative [Perkinsus marinus ATCC 50983]|eukprot:XP_002783657.1 Myosin-2 heavy chain, non muscle, putative [Perkinsus marinus ATCC 50983]
MTTLAAEIRNRLKEDRREMEAMLLEIDDKTNEGDDDTVTMLDRHYSEEATKLLRLDVTQALERLLQSVEDAHKDILCSITTDSDRAEEVTKVKEELATALAACVELQQSEKSRFLEAIESLSAEVDTRIKKEVELAEASRVCTERAMLDDQLELIRDVSDESIDAHKKQLMQLVKDIGAAFKGANASNRKVDTAVNEIAKRLEETYKEQISVLRQEMEEYHKSEMEAAANELQDIFSSEVCLLQEQLTYVMTERDEIQAKLLNAHGETQEKIDNFVAELAKAVETKLNEAIEDLECRFTRFCECQVDEAAAANEAWDDERRELLAQIRHLKLSMTTQTPVSNKGQHIVSAIENALLEGKDVADVYAREAKRLIDRLPILKLIAQREYLSCKRGLASDGSVEDEEDVEKIDKEILKTIDVYEAKYDESFIVGDRVYRDMLSN